MKQNFLKITLIIFITLFINACGGGGGGDTPAAETNTSQVDDNTTTSGGDTPVIEDNTTTGGTSAGTTIVVDDTVENPSTVIRSVVVSRGDTTTNSFVTTTCGATGGIAVYSGIDSNGNGVLDTTEENETPQVVCDGENGFTSLIDTEILVVGDTECSQGGVQLKFGIDLNTDAVLDDDELTKTVSLCNGSTGLDGANGTDGVDGANGTDGVNGSATNTATFSSLATLAGTVPTDDFTTRSISRDLRGSTIRGVTSMSGGLWLTPAKVEAAIQEDKKTIETTTSTPVTVPQPVIKPIEIPVESDGSYELENIPSGDSYALMYINSVGKSKKIENITLTPGGVVTHNIQTAELKNPGGINLTVQSLNSSTTLDGAIVRLNDMDKNTTTSADGSASFENLPEGRYSLTISKDDYLSKYITVDVISDQNVSVGVVELSSLKGKLSGRVVANDVDDYSNIIVYAKGLDGSLYTTLTNSSGNYLFNALPVGSGYSVVAYAHDFQSDKVDGINIINNYTSTANSINLVKYPTTYTSDTSTIEVGSISGFARFGDVTESLNHAGIIISVEGTDFEAISSRDGAFILNNIPNGTYTLNFTDSNHNTVTKEVNVVSGATTHILDVILVAKTGTVSGVLKDDNNQVINNALLSIVSDTQTLTTYSNTSGEYSFAGVTAGDYVINASKDGYNSSQVSFNVTENTQTTITTLALNRLTLSGVVNIENSSDNSGVTISLVSTDIPSATSSSDGNFTLYGVEPGSYELQVSKSGYITATQTVVVFDDSGFTIPSAISLVQSLGTLGGVVNLNGNSDNSGVIVSLLGTSYQTTTNTLGQWSMQLPIGNYTQSLQYTATNNQTYTDESDFTISSTTSITKDTVTLNLNIGTIKGKVLDDSSQALQGVSVVLVSGVNSYTVDTNSTGEFSLDVAVGTYLITASKTGYGYAQKSDVTVIYNNTNDNLYTTPLELASNTITGLIDIEDLTDNKTGVTVTLTNLSDSTTSNGVISDTNGNFSISAVKAGNYKLEISHSNSDYTTTTLELYNIDDDGYIFATPVVINKKPIAKDYELLTFDYIKGQNTNSTTNIRYNLSLPSSLPNGSTVSWSSDEQTLISNSGLVTLPTSSATNTVNLTATVSYTGESNKQVVFAMTVIKDYQPSFSSSSGTFTVNEDFGYLFKTVTATNTNGEAITYSLANQVNSSLLTSLEIDANTGELRAVSKANINGTVTFDVVATTDDQSDTKSITLNITPVADNVTAKLGSDVTTSPNTLVTLDSSASIDIDGDATYSWSLTKPSTSSESLSSSSISNPTFTPDKTGTYTATLTMTNGAGSSSDSITFTVLPTITISDINVTEGSDAVFTMNLSNPSTSIITVDVETLSNSAHIYKDFAKVSQTITFNIGDTVKTISVPVYIDDMPESEESFYLTLKNYTNVIVNNQNALANILYEPLNLTKMVGKAGFVIDGETTSDVFGYSLSTLGDIDGDGYDDFGIGAYGSDKAYIIFGYSNIGNTGEIDVSSTGMGPTLLTKGFTIDASNEGNVSSFGYTISEVGDMNRDGFDDFIVAGRNSRVLIVYGNPTLKTNPDSIIFDFDNGNINGTVITNFNFDLTKGANIASAGDINGDGYDDIILGSSDYTGGDSKVYIIFGKLNISSSIDITSLGGDGITISANSTDRLLGISVSSAGDINGDGYDDVVFSQAVSYMSYDDSYILLGSSNPSTTYSTDNLLKLDDLHKDSSFSSVSGGGDINGDGYDDVILGGVRTGSSYIFYGSADINHSLTITSDYENISTISDPGDVRTGSSVANIGDIDADGYDDVLISDYYKNLPDMFNSGFAAVVYGDTNKSKLNIEDLDLLEGVKGFTITPEASGDELASIVSSAGDINGDGFEDMMLSSISHGNDLGRVYVVFGGNFRSKVDYTGFNDTDTVVTQSGENIIVSGDGADSVTSDGIDDIIYTGNGADTINLTNNIFTRIDGGLGEDTLTFLTEGKTIDLSLYSANMLKNIDIINISGVGPNVLKIDRDTAKRLKDYQKQYPLMIIGNADDKIVFSDDGWEMTPVTSASTVTEYINNGIKLWISQNIPVQPSIYIKDTDTNPGSTFVLYEYKVDESVTVTRSTIDYESSVDYTTSSEGIFFVPTTGTVTFYPGEKTKTIPISLVQNAKFEEDKTFNLTLSNPINGFLTAMPEYTATVNDRELLFPDADQAPQIVKFEYNNMEFGKGIKGLGDVDGRGKDDFIVGMPGRSSNHGENYLIYGEDIIYSEYLISNFLSDNIGIKLTGSTDVYNSGDSVSSAGDFNSDGKSDFIISSIDGGKVFMIFGSDSLGTDGIFDLDNSDLIIDGFLPLIAGFNGKSMQTTTGDLDGDGRNELIVSSRVDVEASNGSDVGAVFIIKGSAIYNGGNFNIDTLISENKAYIITGSSSSELLGYSVESGLSINNDNFDDIIIGTKQGTAYVIYGTDSSDLSDLNDTNTSDKFGNSTIVRKITGASSYPDVALSKDIDGDTYNDILIGNYSFDVSDDEGMVHLIFGTNTVTTTDLNLNSYTNEGIKIAGSITNGYIGKIVGDAGDFDADGYNDIVFGSPTYNDESGHLYVLYGKKIKALKDASTYTLSLDSTVTNNKNGFYMKHDTSKILFGDSVSFCDIDADGYDDILVGVSNTGIGKSYVYIIKGSNHN